MNYYKARQRQDNGLWHYTFANRREGTHPVGYCRDEEGHSTAVEAETCFRRYLLDGQRELEYGDWTGCEVCDEPTKRGIETRPPYGHSHALCDQHRNAERVNELEPSVNEVWSSF